MSTKTKPLKGKAKREARNARLPIQDKSGAVGRAYFPPLQHTIIFQDVRFDWLKRVAKGRGQIGPIDRVCQNDSEQITEVIIKKIDAAATEKTRRHLRRALSELHKAVESVDDGKVLMRIGQAFWMHGAGLMLAAGAPSVKHVMTLTNLTREGGAA